MKHATLRQLKVFESVARNLSFTRAAEELHLTQPTVSIQLKQLSDIVGLPLLEQIGKRIHLTDAGRELLKVCHEIFEGLSRFEMLVSDMKGVKAGKLRLAVITTAKYFVPRLLGPFCQRYPGIDVSLKVTNRERVLQRMADNQDDLYVLGQPPEDLEVVFEPFLENPLVVVAASSHPLAAEKNISPQRLVEEPFLMREPGSGIRLATEQFFRRAGAETQSQDGTRQQRGDQAGGGGRSGDRRAVGAHPRAGSQQRRTGHSQRRRLPDTPSLVSGLSQGQAAIRGRAGFSGFPARGEQTAGRTLFARHSGISRL